MNNREQLLYVKKPQGHMEPDVALHSVTLFAVGSNVRWLWKPSRRIRAAGQVWRLDYAPGH